MGVTLKLETLLLNIINIILIYNVCLIKKKHIAADTSCHEMNYKYS